MEIVFLVWVVAFPIALLYLSWVQRRDEVRRREWVDQQLARNNE